MEIYKYLDKEKLAHLHKVSPEERSDAQLFTKTLRRLQPRLFETRIDPRVERLDWPSGTKVLVPFPGEQACAIANSVKTYGMALKPVLLVRNKVKAGYPARFFRQIDGDVITFPPSDDERYETTYGDGHRIIQLAKHHGCRIIHPGYSKLAEDASFIREAREAGLTIVAPPVEAMEYFAEKSSMKRKLVGLRMASARNLIPGFAISSVRELLLERPGFPAEVREKKVAQAVRILQKKVGRGEFRLPLMVKRGDSGGGKGIRRVDSLEELHEVLLASARRASEEPEAARSYGIVVEQYITGARHIEVQLIGDKHGNLVTGMRECTIQVNNQKYIEESPVSGLPGKLAAQMVSDAVELFRAIGYHNSLTIEFLLDETRVQEALAAGVDFAAIGERELRGYYKILEGNTRMQVERIVLERSLHIDFIDYMLSVEFGETLPVNQSDLYPFRTYAIELRLYPDQIQAIDRQTGVARMWSGFERIETLKLRPMPSQASFYLSYEEGDVGDECADRLIGLVVVTARTRIAAIFNALEILIRSFVRTDLGPTGETNVELLAAILKHPIFQEGRADTHFLRDHFPEIVELRQKIQEYKARLWEKIPG